MKKRNLLLIIVLIISIVLCSCTQKQVNSNDNQSTTIDHLKPLEKLNITGEDITSLYQLWPPNDSNIDDFDEIVSFSIKSKTGTDYTDIDYVFKSNKTINELKALYGTIVRGEWQDSEFTDNSSIYDGFVNETNYTNCLIEDYQDYNRVVLEMDMQQAYSELDATIENHWPTDLLQLHDALVDDNLYLKAFDYNLDENTVSYNISWHIRDKEQDVHDYFKNLLSNNDQYEYLEEYMYAGPFISCNIDGITANIKFNKEMDIVDVIYIRPIN